MSLKNLLVSTAFCAALIASHPALAEPEEHRVLKIDVRVEGQEAWKQAGSWDRATISERFSLVTVLRADPTLDDLNINDPASVKRKQEKAAQVAAKAAQMQNRGKTPNAPSAATQQAMNAAIMQAYQRCKGDEACIRDAVMKSAPQLMTTVPGPSAASKPAIEDDSENEGADDIYQHWLSFEDCPGYVRAFRNDVGKGSIADVGASRPRTIEVKVDVSGPRKGVCNGYAMTVVDTKAQKLWLSEFSFPSVGARNVSTNAGEPPVPQGTSTIPSVVQSWVSKNLKGIPLSGTKTETLALRNPVILTPWGNYSGKITITMTWSFQDPWGGSAIGMPAEWTR